MRNSSRTAYSGLALGATCLLILFGCGPDKRPDRPDSAVLPMLGAALIVPNGDDDPDEQERLFNNDPFQKYPLWLPKINVNENDSVPIKSNWYPDLAVDSRNISHLIYQHTERVGTAPCTDEHHVYYKNDRFESRDLNGFSDLENLSDDPSTTPDVELGFRPEIAVDSQDNLHAVWVVEDGGTRKLRYRLYDRSSPHSTYLWDVPITLSGEDDSDYPHIECDSNDIVHIAFLRLDGSNNPTQVRHLTSTQAKPKMASHFNASTRVDTGMSGTSIPLAAKPRLDLDSTDIPHVAWIDNGGTSLNPGGQDTVKLLYNNKSGGSWGTVIRISNNATGTQVADGDVAAPTTSGLQYFVWEETGSTNAIQFVQRTSGSLGTVKQMNVTTTTVAIPRVVDDTRQQPRILYNTNANDKQAYAAKVKRPKDTFDTADKWGRREYDDTATTGQIETEVEDVEYMEFVLNENDNAYAVFSQQYVDPETCTAPNLPVHFSHTYEANGGGQDAGVNLGVGLVPDPLTCFTPYDPLMLSPRLMPGFGQHQWAPNSVANAHNGNVTLTLPLFSTDGVGFSTSFTLIYNSLRWAKGCMAPGWQHNYHMVLTDHGDSEDVLSVVMPDGMRVVFEWNATHSRFLAPDYFGVFSDIQRDVPARDSGGQDEWYVMQDKFGIQYVFNSKGKLERIVDTQAAQNTMEFQYSSHSLTNPETGDTASLLTWIVDSTGKEERETVLDYDSKARLNKVTDPHLPTGRDYDIYYDSGEDGKVNRVVYPKTGVEWKFEYYTTNDISANQKKRNNLLWKVKTPRAVSDGTYYWELRYRQDNRALSATDPADNLITDDTDIDATTSSVQTKRQLLYTEPIFNQASPPTFQVPNDKKPDESQPSYAISYEPNESATVNTTISITGNNVPKVAFRDERENETDTEYQYLRSLADNVTDPDGNYLRRFFNSSVSGNPDTAATYRNLTVFVDKRGTATKYEYLTGTAPDPDWVLDNVSKIHPPKALNNENDTAPGSSFESAIEYTYTTDNFNRVATVKDSRTNTTTYTRDAYGNVTKIAYPQVTLFGGGTQTAEEEFTYDNEGRLKTSKSAACDALARYFYDDDFTGLVTRYYPPESSKAWTYIYDNLGNTTAVTSPEYSVGDDSGGHPPIGGGQPEVSLVFQRDELYRVTHRTDPGCGLHITQYTYDLDSNITGIACQGVKSRSGPYNTPPDEMRYGRALPALGPETTYAYDKAGALTSTTQPDASTTMSVEYDRVHNVRRTIDYRSNTASKSLYDKLQRPTDVRFNISSTTSPPPSDVFTQTTFVYDANGNTTETRREGNPASDRVTTMTYNPRNTLATVTHPDTTVDTIEYDANDNPTKSYKKKVSTLVYGYAFELDERNRTRKITDLSDEDPVTGLAKGYVYDANNNLVRVEDASGRTRDWAYDCRNRTIHEKDGSGNVLREYRYDDDDRVVEVLVPDPRGGNELITAVTYQHCPDDQVHLVFDANGVQVLKNIHDVEGRIKRQIDARGIWTDYAYDTLGRLTQIVRDDDGRTGGPGALDYKTDFAYDKNHNRTKITINYSASSEDYDLSYTKGNQLEKLEYPQIGANPRNDEEWTYNEFAEVATYTDANAKVVTLTYDTSGRVTTEAHGTPHSVTLTRTYTDGSLLDTIDDATVKLDFDYDVYQRVTKVDWLTNSGGWSSFKDVDYTYDSSHNRATMTEPEGAIVTYGYDQSNRLIAIDRQDGSNPEIRYAQMGYDVGGRLKTIEFGNGVKETLERDIKGQIDRLAYTKSDGSVLASIGYVYDDRGDRTSVSYEHLGVRADFEYDNIRRLTGEIWSGNRCKSGAFINVTASGGGNESTSYSPVATDEPAAVTAVPPHYQFYTYDAAGNRLTLTGIDRGASYTYDEENRLTTENPFAPTLIAPTGSNASSTESGYSHGTIKDADTTDQANTTYAWRSLDQSGQHTAEVSWSGSKTITQIRVYMPTSEGGATKFKVQYDNASTWTDPTILGVIGAEEHASASGWYTTTCHEIIFAISEVSTTKIRFVQDDGGGGSSPNIAWLNELEAYEKVTGDQLDYTYDSNGNLTQRYENVSGGDDVEEDYEYDYANRLDMYKKTTGVTVNTHYTYSYAPTGERFEKKNELTSAVDRYMYDGPDVVADYEKNGASWDYKRSYVQRLSIDRKVARIDNGGSTYYYLGDALGSVHYMLTSTGGIENTQITNAWGEHIVDTQNTTDRHGFTQRERDTESGLMHFRARAYDPRVGRFTKRDPIPTGRVQQHYLYASNNPVGRVDPMGMQDSSEGDSGLKIDVGPDYQPAVRYIPKERFYEKVHSLVRRGASGRKQGKYQGDDTTSNLRGGKIIEVEDTGPTYRVTIDENSMIDNAILREEASDENDFTVSSVNNFLDQLAEIGERGDTIAELNLYLHGTESPGFIEFGSQTVAAKHFEQILAKREDIDVIRSAFASGARITLNSCYQTEETVKALGQLLKDGDGGTVHSFTGAVTITEFFGINLFGTFLRSGNWMTYSADTGEVTIDGQEAGGPTPTEGSPGDAPTPPGND